MDSVLTTDQNLEARSSLRVRELVALTCGALVAPLLGQVLLRLAARGAPPSSDIWSVSLATALAFIVAIVGGALVRGWRGWRAALVSGAVALLGATAWGEGAGGGVSGPALMACLAAPFTHALAVGLVRQLPEWLEQVSVASRAGRLAMLASLLLLVLQGMRLSTYMTAPSEAKASIYYFPGLHAAKTRRTSYTTVTTYANASAHNRADPMRNVYDERLYPLSVEGSAALPAALPGRGLSLDGGFLYPPPFLPIFRGLLLLTDDVTWLRTAWFAVEGGLLSWAFFAMLPCLGLGARRHALLFAPLSFVSFTTLVALQVGNYHVAMFALCVLGLAYTERGHQKLGGALLGVAAATKLYPFALLLPLWLWRRRPAAGALLAAAAAQTLLALLWCGPRPFLDFAHYALPRLSNGQAFPFLNDPQMLPGNFSAAAIGLKLAMLSDLSWTPQAQQLVSKFLGLAAGATGCLGLVSLTRDSHARLLLGVSALNLLVLTPPWAPGYVQLGFLWLLLLLPVERRWATPAWLWGALWVALFCPDLPFLKPAWRTGYTLAVQLLAVALNLWLLLRGARHVPATAGATSGENDERSTRNLGILG